MRLIRLSVATLSVRIMRVERQLICKDHYDFWLFNVRYHFLGKIGIVVGQCTMLFSAILSEFFSINI